MKQNLVSLKLTNAEITTLNGSLVPINTIFANRAVSLDPEQRRTLTKMGDKSRPFCQEAINALQSNAASLPPDFDLSELADDMADFDKLNAFAAKLGTLVELVDDTLKAISSDVMTSCIFGVGFLKALNKLTASLDNELQGLKGLRRSKAVKKPKTPKSPTP
jgi:hypothetical protein